MQIEETSFEVGKLRGRRRPLIVRNKEPAPEESASTDALVDADPRQPGRWILVVLNGRPFPPGGEHRLLNGVLGLTGIVDDGQGKPMKARGFGEDELLEGNLAPSLPSWAGWGSRIAHGEPHM
jgi:hypothetical protein